MMSRALFLACALMAGACWSSAALAAKGHSGPSCTKQSDGTTEVDSLTARAGTSPPYVLTETSTRDVATGAVSFQLVIAQRKATVLDVTATVSRTQIDIVTTYGHGFKGIATSELTGDGSTFHGVVDGRQTIPFASGADPSSVTFQDGKPPPRLRVKPGLRKAIKKFGMLRLDTCARTAKAARDVLQNCPFTDDLGLCEPFPGCNNCYRLCDASYIACGWGAIASAALCAPCAFVSGASCIEEEAACHDMCQSPDHACCPLECNGHCSGGHAGDMCCGNEGCSQTDCCGTGQPFCCSPGDTCVDAAKGICCPTDHGDECLNGCCPSGQSCIDGFMGAKTCCPTGDNACGPDNACCPGTQECCGDNCCGAGQTCIAPATCCNITDVCGSTCCPSHNCLNGTTCCDAPNFACGGSCCGALDTCCNGSCCSGQCLAGQCCPPERLCGTTCCAPGFACTDPASGTCQACPAGNDPCPAGVGDPICCPTGTLCCGNGACCDLNSNMTCCTIGVVGCYPTSQCIQ
jgi:hypothetical protein